MGLARRQQLLARLYTDPELRRLFLMSPREVGAEYRLSSDEIEELSHISGVQLDVFGASLLRKRLQEARTLLPYAYRALGAEFDAQFRRYAEHLPGVDSGDDPV